MIDIQDKAKQSGAMKDLESIPLPSSNHSVDERDTSGRAPRILIGHGDPRASLNLGDIAMVANVVAKLQRMVPKASIRLIGIEPPSPWRIPGVDYVPELVSLFDDPGTLLTERIITLVRRIPRFATSPRSALRRAFAGIALGRRHKFLAARFRNERLEDIIERMSWADIFFEAGHGGFTELFYHPDIADKVFLIRLARLLGKPVVMSGHGYGPISQRRVLSEVRTAVDGVEFLGIRADSGLTRETLEKLELRNVEPQYTGDDACDLENSDPAEIERILQSAGIPTDRPLMAVHVRERRAGGGSGAMRFLKRVLDHLTKVSDWHFVVVPMRYSPADETDCDAARSLTAILNHPERTTVLDGEFNSRDIRGVIGRCVVGIGMAYHFSVFCLTQGIPSIGLVSSDYYRGKVRALYRHFQCEESVFEVNDDPERAAARLIAIRDNADLQRVLTRSAEDWSMRCELPLAEVRRLLRDFALVREGVE
jgi:polysaccharide pyruvyl transferase WcaK-like protein